MPLLALCVTLAACLRQPPLEPGPLEATVAGVVLRKDGPTRLRVECFSPGTLLPWWWHRVSARTLVVAVVEPGAVLLAFSRGRPNEIVGGARAIVPRPGCYWFGGVEVTSPTKKTVLLTAFSLGAEAVRSELVARNVEARCISAMEPLPFDLAHPADAFDWSD